LLALGENLLDGVLQNLRRDLRHGVERFVFFFLWFRCKGVERKEV
jgi:hypothetical protein